MTPQHFDANYRTAARKHATEVLRMRHQLKAAGAKMGLPASLLVEILSLSDEQLQSLQMLLDRRYLQTLLEPGFSSKSRLKGIAYMVARKR